MSRSLPLRDHLYSIAFVVVTLLAGFGVGYNLAPQPDPAPTLVPATILHVDEGEPWQSTETLLELDDGRRITRRAYLGPVGDQLVIEVPR